MPTNRATTGAATEHMPVRGWQHVSEVASSHCSVLLTTLQSRSLVNFDLPTVCKLVLLFGKYTRGCVDLECRSVQVN